MLDLRRIAALRSSALAIIVLALGLAPARAEDPFARIDLPDGWEAKFWSDPAAKALLALEPKALAELVPVQAGVRYCRCPVCATGAGDDSLAWSVLKPEVLTCTRCGLTVPNDEIPAKEDKKIPQETVEVLPRVYHHYPYHAVPAEKQFYPDERLYVAAKRDYEAREFLAKAALYAAVRSHEQAPAAREPALARLVATILLRFAQVYPAYSTHYDQPGEPKYFEPADLPPPYRRGYRTGKWDATANLDVPINLAIAYALIRNDPALAEAGRLLGDPNPAATIENRFFRASAEFVRLQPEEYSEMSLQAYRGLLAVGRLLDDPALVQEARTRLEAFAQHGFYHDGFWRAADTTAHRRVLGIFDAWFERLLAGSGEVPMLALARGANAVTLGAGRRAELLQVNWPAVAAEEVPRHAGLLGGAGLARLAVGQGGGALDLELRGLDGHGAPHFQRQAIRLSVAGGAVLGDLDDLPHTANGWDRATACHNTVVVDGLNQRESMGQMQTPAPGGQFLFFGADPEFQVTALEDRQAYPQSTTRYRQTLVAVASARTRYAVSVFEVEGGLQHDQVFHAAPGCGLRWHLAEARQPAPATLLPPSITYVPTARAEDGRWFVQSYGEFALLNQGKLTKPTTATLARTDWPGMSVRLHLLGSAPATAYTALSVDPAANTNEADGAPTGRAGLIVRRSSENGATLKSTFVTVFEPIGSTSPPLLRVGRVAEMADAVVLYIETAEGVEHIVIPREPGTVRRVQLGDGRELETDGLVVRATTRDLFLAGGTFAACGKRRTTHRPATGQLVSASRGMTTAGRGWFVTDRVVPDPDALVGRTLLVRHGDGTTHGWTLTRVVNSPAGDSARLHVHEEPGFLIDSETGLARYYQFPRDALVGPHAFAVSRISRASLTGPLPAVDISR